jgi:hypothetical protein
LNLGRGEPRLDIVFCAIPWVKPRRKQTQPDFEKPPRESSLSHTNSRIFKEESSRF